MSGVFFTTVIIFLLLAVLFDTYLNSEKNAALRGSLYWCMTESTFRVLH